MRLFKGKVRIRLNKRMGGGRGGELCTIIHWFNIIYHLTQKRACPAIKTQVDSELNGSSSSSSDSEKSSSISVL